MKSMEEVITIDFDMNRIRYHPDYSDTLKLDEIELMQYTGLKDKNGTEIYEGDILHLFSKKTAPMANNGIDTIVEVKHICQFAGEDWYGSECAEVIGNIYENPELLEVG